MGGGRCRSGKDQLDEEGHERPGAVLEDTAGMSDPRTPPRQPEPPDRNRDDEVPDTPPTEPPPVPVQDPPAEPDERGPYIT